MKTMRRILKVVLIAAGLLIAGFAGLIIYAVITDYKPDDKINVSLNHDSSSLSDTATLTFLTWNIGYCGLDRDMDFFYDGGTKVFTPGHKCIENLAAVEKFLTGSDSVDFIFVQEVDRNSKRSYNIDEYDSIASRLNDFRGFFATNYKVFFVPVPPASPMGKVLSGLATFSKAGPVTSVRYSFPGEYAFPKQLFMLDRCFLVNRYPLDGGKELLIINTHNEAFDKGDIRKAQMAYLKTFLSEEYKKGNYVITGGDWNQTPPDFTPAFSRDAPDSSNMVIPSGFLPGDWKWIFDNTNPSERSVVRSYDQGNTPTTVIDFFLVSPNVEALSVKCIHLDFLNSDHNPVIMKVKLSGSTH